MIIVLVGVSVTLVSKAVAKTSSEKMSRSFFGIFKGMCYYG